MCEPGCKMCAALDWEVTMCCVGSWEEQQETRRKLLTAMGNTDLNRQLLDSLIDMKREHLRAVAIHRRCRTFSIEPNTGTVTSIDDWRTNN